MNYVWAIITALYFIAIIGAIITVLMENRQPVKTMAWIMVLVFLPVFGIILYFFFGQNIRREHIIHSRSLDEITKRTMLEFAEQENLILPGRHKSLINLFKNQNLSLPFKDNEVEIFTSGHDFFLSLIYQIGQAKDHIHLESFIFEDDPLGQLIADALIDRAKKGVEIRIIYDSVACWSVPNNFFEKMRNAGIDVRGFMPVRFPRLTNKVNYRNHRKMIVIDGRTGYVGGMNIALRYAKGQPGTPWRDTHMLIRGKVVYSIQRSFLIDWYFVDRTLINDHKYYPDFTNALENNCLAQLVTGSPASPWPEMMQGYLRILLEAKEYVYMESPYFLPTQEIIFAMTTVALSGIDVRLIVPKETDSRIIQMACRSYLLQAAKGGVKVYLYDAGFNHSKLLISDDSLCTCGSTNIDFRSFDHNFESNMFFYDKEVSLRLKRVFLDDLKQCTSLNKLKNINERPFPKRLWESIVRLVSPLL